MRSVRGSGELRRLIGSDLPPSPWLEITQDRVNAFARVTCDEQWIHVDPALAAAGPFGTTVAHGFLTLSLIPYFWRESVHVEGFAVGINYGLNAVRFPAPVTIPSRLRASFRVDDVADVPGGVQALIHTVIEREGEVKPVCVAEVLIRYICQSK